MMIVSFLLFSEVLNTPEEALLHYAEMRTRNGKGVTIASQIRYIKIFHKFLETYVKRPFAANYISNFRSLRNKIE